MKGEELEDAHVTFIKKEPDFEETRDKEGKRRRTLIDVCFGAI